MERETALLLAVVGGRPGPVVESVSAANLPPRRCVELRAERLDRFVGVRHDAADVASILSRLGFVREVGGWRVPSFRFDVEREVDLIEEVCRIRAYEQIPMGRPLTALSRNRVPLSETPKSRLRAL